MTKVEEIIARELTNTEIKSKGSLV